MSPLALSGVNGRLRICLDSLNNCPLEISGREIDTSWRQWRNYHLVVPEGIHAVGFFLVQNVKI